MFGSFTHSDNPSDNVTADFVSSLPLFHFSILIFLGIILKQIPMKTVN